MATVRRRGDLAATDARRASRNLGIELRATRQAAGLSLATTARAAGMSPAQLGRLERGEIGRVDLEQLARGGRALGLQVAVRFYPVGSPVRDSAQLALLQRLERRLGAPLRLRREVPLALSGDLRAWDGMIGGDGDLCFVEAETRIADVQDLERRLRRKQRDDPRARTIVLVASRSRHNRRVLADHREALRDLLPQDGAAILRALRNGRCPSGGGLVQL